MLGFIHRSNRLCVKTGPIHFSRDIYNCYNEEVKTMAKLTDVKAVIGILVGITSLATGTIQVIKNARDLKKSVDEDKEDNTIELKDEDVTIVE